MNDFQRLTSVFDSIGVKYDVKTSATSKTQAARRGTIVYTYNQEVIIEDHNHIGYDGFCTNFYFLNGMYVTVGVWE